MSVPLWRGWAIADKRGRLVICGDGSPFPYRTKKEAMRDCDPSEGDKPVRVEMRARKGKK